MTTFAFVIKSWVFDLPSSSFNSVKRVLESFSREDTRPLNNNNERHSQFDDARPVTHVRTKTLRKSSLNTSVICHLQSFPESSESFVKNAITTSPDRCVAGRRPAIWPEPSAILMFVICRHQSLLRNHKQGHTFEVSDTPNHATHAHKTSWPSAGFVNTVRPLASLLKSERRIV
jgi:hypothetical protein